MTAINQVFEIVMYKLLANFAADNCIYMDDTISLWWSTDCGSNDPDLKEEMEKQFVDLLTEELKLQESVAEAHTRHMNITLAEAKRVGSQYQREADKCIAATETCEQAREQAEAKLTKERKMTLVWERRARQMGWEGGE